MACSASATLHAPLASILIFPPEPSASRTASIRATSSTSDWPRSATLTLAVRQPAARAIAYASSGPTAGTVLLTGISVLSGAGQPRSAASSAARSHGTSSAPA